MKQIKRSLSFLLALCLMASMIPVTARAATSGTCGENVTWTLSDDGVLTISGSGPMTDFYTAPWYYYRNSIKTVVIKDNVTSIVNLAFEDCSNLCSVTIGSSVASIGYCAFVYCESLTEVTIPASVTSIDDSAFANCYGLKGIYVDPDNPNYASDEHGVLFNKSKTILIRAPYAYEGHYDIPDGVATIAGGAFDFCESLTSVTICDSVTSIEGSAFAECPNLSRVVIGNGVTSIGNYAFELCTNLASLYIGNNVTSIGDDAFSSCYSLRSVMIPDSVITIGDDAFYRCSDICNLIIGNNVVSIGNQAFYGIDGITSVSIPESVTFIGNNAFGNCNSLSGIYVDINNPSYANDEYGVLYNKSTTILMQVPVAFEGHYSIPKGVITISVGAFEWCERLTGVTIPDGVISIGDDAFFDCSVLTNVTIPDSVTSIGDDAFMYCDALTDIYFCGNAPSIESRTFCRVVATAYYPANNPTWTSDVMQDYGGNITWVPYNPGETPGGGGGSGGSSGGTTEPDAPSPLVIKWGEQTFDYYSSIMGKTASYYFDYDENWFFEDSTTYNHELAQMSIRMAMAGGTTKGKSIDKMLRTLQFTDIASIEKTYPYPTAQPDSIGYALGSKDITNENGEKITLVSVVIRSAGYKSEWASNVTVGLGSDHYGFDSSSAVVAEAVEQYIDKLDTKNEIKVWITGFSRGAAVSNLVASRLNVSAKAGYIPRLSENGIYAYCFATPQSVTTQSGRYSANAKNIFNVVNPVDLVPMVAPSGWDFNRCGKTYYLPSAELNNSGYQKGFGKMVQNYTAILEAAKCPDAASTAQDVASTIPLQHTTFSGFVDLISFVLGNQMMYYTNMEEIFVGLMASMNDGDGDAGTVLMVLLGGTALMAEPALLVTVPVIAASATHIGYAHYPEFYLAWMDALDGGYINESNRVRYLKVNCPVDVSVYDSNGNLVAQIVDNEIQLVEDSTIEAGVDMNGQKVVALPADEEFRIEITATDEGTMSYQIEEHDLEQGGVTHVLNYNDIEIEQGDTISGTVDQWYEDDSAEYIWEDNDGTEITVTNEVTVEALAEYSVTLSSEGHGSVAGGGMFLDGEYCQITANAYSGEQFLGWYRDGVLISTNTEYRFRVETDAIMVGKFSESSANKECTHSWNSGYIIEEPTCTDVGKVSYICTICGETNMEDVSPVGHNYEDGICTTCGAVMLSAPVAKGSNNESTGKPVVTWEPVEGAVKYEVYRSTKKDGTYTRGTSTTGTTYTNTKAVAGKYYYYFVRAIDADGNYADSNIVGRTCDLAQTTVTLSNVASTGKIKISWEAVDGATKYEVYRATSKDGTYSRISTTANTSVTNTKAEAGKTYYYKVRAICDVDAAAAAYSAVKSRTCDLPRPEVTLSNVASSGKIKVSWKTIDGAVKYEVYRATSKDGTYKLVKTTTGTSFTNTSTTAGKTYYYKVKAIASKSSADSAYSEDKSRTCDLPRPDVSIALSSKKPKVSWDKVTGAVEYKVYRATSKTGTYSLVKTTTSLSYRDTKATAGKTYYYKVVAVCSNTSGNSAYSSVVSIKATK